jgi:glycosyltransferase involved in cell wall biosynthesis
MRLGKNELKVHAILKPARITAVVVTFIPEETGYFQDRLSVVRLSLESLVKHADLPVDLMVFDNGSCPALVKFLLSLKDKGIIKYLILSSKNVGLSGAYRIVSRAAPGEIIAFANDDVFYYPNWLSPQVEILEKFPDVGLVSGAYLRGTHPRTAKLAAEKGLTVEEVESPREWMDEFCRGASYLSPEDYYRSQQVLGWTDLHDNLIYSEGAKAYAGGVCWQAVFQKDELQALLPQDDPKDYGWSTYDSYFHNTIVERGYLRLSTTDRYVHHIGNVVTPELVELAAAYGLSVQSEPVDRADIETWRSIMKIRPIRFVVKRLHNWSYRMLKSYDMKS